MTAKMLILFGYRKFQRIYQKTSETDEFSKVTGCQVNIQKSAVTLRHHQLHVEFETLNNGLYNSVRKQST